MSNITSQKRNTADLQTYLECFQIIHPRVRAHCQKVPERLQTRWWRAAWRHQSLQRLEPVLEPHKRGQVRHMPERKVRQMPERKVRQMSYRMQEREMIQRPKVQPHQIL
jgi:hypothetical protein